MIENHTAYPTNPPLHLSDLGILVVKKSLDNLNPIFTYINNKQNPTLNPLNSSEDLGTTSVHPQMVSRRGNTSN